MTFQRFKKNEYLRLPSKPGIYKFLDRMGHIIYVGKAKNLKKRVSSYFTKSNLNNRKTYHLVREICQIECVIVTSEFDALLLENNLIKENKPKYNILLKDDKSFPNICITNERFPRIYSTRRTNSRLGEYYGPYTSVKAVNGVLDLIRKLYNIRTCKYNLSETNIKKKKYKVCLEYHIGNCSGPCAGLQLEESYLKDIDNARKILKGKLHIVQKSYKEQMTKAAESLRFETAQDLKNKLELLEKFQSKTLIVNQKNINTDIFTIVSDKKSAFINYLRIQSGFIVNSEIVEVKRKLEESDEEILRFAIFDLRKKYNSNHKEILTNLKVKSWEGVEISIPQIGDKKKLIELSRRNALFFRKEKRTRMNIHQPNAEILKKLMEDFKLPDLPTHIECFDNSNFQGTNAVASMICFINGKPSKLNYRKYNIKTIIGPDDFASMKEIINRRYSLLKKRKNSFPNLIVIDGGKGQLNAACDALRELGIYGEIPIIGIAKRLEEIYFPQDEIPLHINKTSTSLKLIQQIRDEAHRFAITFHKQKRSKQSIESTLDSVHGIGPATKQKLISKLKSVKRIKETPESDLATIIGEAKAKALTKAIEKGNI